MGIWKAQLTTRIPVEFRQELETWATKERRNLSNLTGELLIWAFEQLKVAGNLTRLLNFNLGKPKEQKK